MDLVPSATGHRRLTLAILMAAAFAVPPTSTARAQPQVVVDTAEGPVVGVAGDAATAWKGIPFAAPPVGELRWSPPAPAPHRSSPLDATAFGPACPQTTTLDIPGLPGPPAGNRGAEDCLQLNIWAPNAAGAGLPVMFWIHGGGMIQGSGTDAPYDGANLATSQNVVVVTTNYRLGALGFLAHEAFVGEQSDYPGAGNYGLLDAIAALRWVRANIAGFGGDPGRVTIFGESAGGVNVCALMAAPAAAGLFHRAIMESGNCLPRMPSLDPTSHPGPPALEQGNRFAEAIGCADATDVAACLRAQDVDKILATMPGEIGVLNPGAEVYGPIVDGTLLAETPGEAFAAGHEQGVPFILGANADEATIFTAPFQNLTAAQYEALVRLTFPGYGDRALALYPAAAYQSPTLAFADVAGDVGFVCPARWAAGAHARHGAPAYLYHFSYVPGYAETLRLGAHHAIEIPFVFGNIAGLALLSPEVRQLTAAMGASWSAFARSGNPGSHDGLAWPRYTPEADALMEFSSPPKVTAGLRREKCDLWDEVEGRQLPAAWQGVFIPAVMNGAVQPNR